MSRVAVEGWVTVETARSMFDAAGYDLASLKAEAAARTFVPVELQSEAQELRVSRLAAFLFAATGITLSVIFQHENINILAATAFSIAASATFPCLVLALFWRGLTTVGAISGGVVGLVSSVAGVILGPAVWVGVLGNAEPVFPYQFPTIVAMPLSFAVGIGMSLLCPERTSV